MPTETELRQRLELEAGSCYSWSNGADFRYAVHSHPYRKILYCVRGSIRFELPDRGEQVELNPGDRFDLPPGVSHGALVGPHGVTCIEGQGT